MAKKASPHADKQAEAFSFDELASISDRDVDGGADSSKSCKVDQWGRHRPNGDRRNETDESVECRCSECGLWFQVDRNPPRWVAMYGGKS